MVDPCGSSSPEPDSPLWEAALAHVTGSAPEWFPHGVPVVGEWQIPAIAAPKFDSLPRSARAYDKRGRVADGALLLHGYVQDHKLRTQLTNPAAWLARFRGFGGVIAPDFSIRADDPPDRKVFAVRMSRAVGAYYASRGLKVVPTIRWGDSRDFGYCFDGVSSGSVVAISNHGCWRTGVLRQGFLAGLPVLVERLKPAAVYVHGTVDHVLFRQLASKTEFIHLEADRTRVSRERI